MGDLWVGWFDEIEKLALGMYKRRDDALVLSQKMYDTYDLIGLCMVPLRWMR